MSPCHFSLSPELAWIITVLEESVGVTPAPFIVELEYNRDGAGKAGPAADPASLPATALSGVTATPGVREMVAAEQDDILIRFAVGDCRAASRDQVAANNRCRKDNQGEGPGHISHAGPAGAENPHRPATALRAGAVLHAGSGISRLKDPDKSGRLRGKT